MYNFVNDYSEGAHPSILKKLAETNLVQTMGYGEDAYCAEAKMKIREALKHDSAVEFMMTGTQTNLTVISHLLRPYEGIVGVKSCHPANHETGAIEATGHKIIIVPSGDGKLKAPQVEKILYDHINNPIKEHSVRPGLVYISDATEMGTVYTKKELSDLHDVCRKYSIPLYIDGARLGCALMSSECDFSFPDLADLCDVFYIGGTKMGALFGEALIFNEKKAAENFLYSKKQRGALLSKGRLLGIQFSCLFENGLYFKIARDEVKQAQRIQDALIANGIPLMIKSPTNQIFPILTKAQREFINTEFNFEIWENMDDDKASVRFCTSWATDPRQVDKLIEKIKLLNRA